ncbi:hypothetical protein NLS1_32140 [Nocardioides sp. LS1]|nr:hypothetical protein NLS1_32140 [Nocardioides sp. LS1]
MTRPLLSGAVRGGAHKHTVTVEGQPYEGVAAPSRMERRWSTIWVPSATGGVSEPDKDWAPERTADGNYNAGSIRVREGLGISEVTTSLPYVVAFTVASGHDGLADVGGDARGHTDLSLAAFDCDADSFHGRAPRQSGRS